MKMQENECPYKIGRDKVILILTEILKKISSRNLSVIMYVALADGPKRELPDIRL